MAGMSRSNRWQTAKYDRADNRTNVQVNVGSLPACP
jgi:hypothetical protein